MNPRNFFVLLVLLLPVCCLAQPNPPSVLEGRWDITVKGHDREWPSWLEVRHSGNHTYIGRFVSVTGSARPISRVEINGSNFSFKIPPQWEKGDGDLSLEGSFTQETIGGTVTYPDGKSYSWEGVRAPALRSTKTPEWSESITLFNGKDLTGWNTRGGKNQWIAENGVLKNPAPGSNLFTDQRYSDFKLHIEFRLPAESNSGIYLRGRYEVQITDAQGQEPWDDQFSGIYGFLEPIFLTAKHAGEWQSYDITLVGRVVTVVANGVTVISNQVIPGITGGAIDSKEGEPGPIMLQGDHGSVEFRNIVLTPAK